MKALVEAFFQICLLRMRPQDLPASQSLLGIAIAADMIAAIALFSIKYGFLAAVMLSFTGLLLMVLLTVSLLYAVGLSARTTQTLSALAGTDAIVCIAAMPVEFTIASSADNQALLALAGLIYLALVIWNLTITGHILRHAVSIPFPAGLVLALVIFVLSSSIISQLFTIGQAA